MERTIDTITLRGSFSQELPEKLDLDSDLTVLLQGSIVKEEVGSNQDGTVKLVLKFKPMLVDIKVDES